MTVRRIAALPTYAFVRPNFQVPPFNDLRARQALALLVDQNEMMPAVAGAEGRWSVCHSFSVCGSVYGTEAGPSPIAAANVARARQLLQEAGYRGEPLILLGTTTLAPINTMTQVLARRLQDAGRERGRPDDGLPHDAPADARAGPADRAGRLSPVHLLC